MSAKKLADAFRPFVMFAHRENPVNMLSPKRDRLTPITITVTKGQVLDAMEALKLADSEPA